MVTILLENVLNSCLLWYTNKLQNIKEIVLGTCITAQQGIFQGVQFSQIGYVSNSVVRTLTPVLLMHCTIKHISWV